MKKSIAIMLLVATSVVAIAVGAGIWYTRPSAPLAIIEEAKARQRQPLLEVVPPPARAEAVEVLPADYSDLVDELLPLIQDRLAPQQAPTTLSSDQRAYVDQAVEALRQDLLRTVSTQVDHSYVDQQVNLLKGELKELDAKQVDHQALIASITAEDLRPIFSVYKNELLREVRSEQPRTTVVMSGEVDESILFNNLAWEIEDNLDFYAAYARDAILATIDQDDLIALYESYRPLLVADLATSLPASTTTITQGKDIDEDELFSHFAQEIDENKAFYATYVRDAVLDTISDEDLLSYYSYYRPALVADLGPAFAQVPVTMVADNQQILGALASEVEANKSFYASYVRDAVLDTISDDDLLGYYSYYRPALVADLSGEFSPVVEAPAVDEESVLAALSAEIEANKGAYAAWARDAILETISDDDLFANYTYYRPVLLADLYSGIKDEAKAEIADYADIIDQMEANRAYYLENDRKALPGIITEADLLPLYASYRGELADDLFGLLGDEIESHKDLYAAYVRSALGDLISEDDLIALYEAYRPAIVADLAVGGAPVSEDALLGALSAEIDANKAAYAAWARDAILETISDDDLYAYYSYYRPALVADLAGEFATSRAEGVDAEAIIDELLADIEANKSAYAAWARDAIAETISDDDLIDLYLTYRGALVADLLTELPAAQMRADAQEVLDALFTEIETNKPEYAAYVRDAIIDTISDEDLIAYYLYYRPELLEDIYQGLRGRFGEVRIPPSPAPATSQSVPVVVEEVSTPPALVVEEIVQQPEVVVPRIPAPPAAIAKPAVVLEELTSAEYEALRQNRRTEALEEVFGKIK